MEYSLVELIDLLKRRVAFIIVCTLIGLSSLYIMNSFIKKPYYTASVQMYVDPKASTSVSDLNEISYAQKVILTYVYFLRTKVFYEQVLEECKLDYSTTQLKAMTTIEIISNTEIFQISVTSYDPKDSYTLVDTMQNVAPRLIKSIKDTAEISVVDPVTMPVLPSGPNIYLYTFIGGILGFILSIILIFIWEIIDINVKNQDDLIKKYQLPVLGAIPNYNSYKDRRIKFLNNIPLLRKRFLKRSISGIKPERKFEVIEAYNELRTNLRFTLVKKECKKIIISSPVPEDGKSTTSTNLAIATAQAGSKVLLIDCDLRKGKLHSLLKLKSKPGISDALSVMVNEKDVIQNTPYENLHVISMGSIPPNPTGLLSSVKMNELLQALESNYDFIIFDTPPINVVPDVLSLIQLVDGVIIVVREGITSHPHIVNALTKYGLADANILGFVINGVSHKHIAKSKSHYYYKN